MKFSSFSIGQVWKELRKFDSLTEDESSIVFYAENKASMNHFKTLIHELTEKLHLNICYVTSVKDDLIFSDNNPRIKSFYIGDGAARTKFFLTLKAKILIMDMPDLEQFHIKRSKVYPVHYIYIFHSMFSIHSYLRKGALDNYDTIFCVGPHHINEIRETEKLYRLTPKKLVSYGFGRLDTLLKEKNQNSIERHNENLILITPSYGENNLLVECGIELIDSLLKNNFKVLLRPHFRIFHDSPKLIESIKEKFGSNANFIFENGIIPPKAFHSSICMISDWSRISLEYAFTFERPVIFIDVPKKILNPNFSDICLEPIEVSIRNELGFVIPTKDISKIPTIIKNSCTKNVDIQEKIQLLREKIVFNVGKSAIIGAKYIDELNHELSSS